MFEVYLNHKRDLLVVKKGSPLPLIGESGKWRMKRKVLRVSDEIRSAVQKHGYYVRKLSDAKNSRLPPVELAPSFGRRFRVARSLRCETNGLGRVLVEATRPLRANVCLASNSGARADIPGPPLWAQ
jgi:hypothetical protein